jgi:hypothetical protein
VGYRNTRWRGYRKTYSAFETSDCEGVEEDEEMVGKE